MLCLGGDFGRDGELLLVLRLDAGVDNQWRLAFPMLVFDSFVETINILGGVGARKREPEKIAQDVVCAEGAFVNDGNPGIVFAELPMGEGIFEFAESFDVVFESRGRLVE